MLILSYFAESVLKLELVTPFLSQGYKKTQIFQGLPARVAFYIPLFRIKCRHSATTVSFETDGRHDRLDF